MYIMVFVLLSAVIVTLLFKVCLDFSASRCSTQYWHFEI